MSIAMKIAWLNLKDLEILARNDGLLDKPVHMPKAKIPEFYVHAVFKCFSMIRNMDYNVRGKLKDYIDYDYIVNESFYVKIREYTNKDLNKVLTDILIPTRKVLEKHFLNAKDIRILFTCLGYSFDSIKYRTRLTDEELNGNIEGKVNQADYEHIDTLVDLMKYGYINFSGSKLNHSNEEEALWVIKMICKEFRSISSHTKQVIGPEFRWRCVRKFEDLVELYSEDREYFIISASLLLGMVGQTLCLELKNILLKYFHYNEHAMYRLVEKRAGKVKEDTLIKMKLSGIESLQDTLGLTDRQEILNSVCSILRYVGIAGKIVHKSRYVSYAFNENGCYAVYPSEPYECQWNDLFYVLDKSIWNKVVKEFKVGMTLEECILLYIDYIPTCDDTIRCNGKSQDDKLDRLIGKIYPPIFERETGNEDRFMFDYIRVTVGITKNMFDTREELKEEVERNLPEITKKVYSRVKRNDEFKQYRVRMKDICISRCIFTADCTLDYTFELKNQVRWI